MSKSFASPNIGFQDAGELFHGLLVLQDIYVLSKK